MWHDWVLFPYVPVLISATENGQRTRTMKETRKKVTLEVSSGPTTTLSLLSPFIYTILINIVTNKNFLPNCFPCVNKSINQIDLSPGSDEHGNSPRTTKKEKTDKVKLQSE